MPTPTADKRMILEALGWKAAHDENEDRWILYSPDGARFNSTSFRDTDSEAPEHIFDPVEIDPNFCFANIVPFLTNTKPSCSLRIVAVNTGLRTLFGCELSHGEWHPNQDVISTEAPTVEAAIQQAFISYRKEQQV